MTKIKKCLTLITAAAMASSLIAPLRADAAIAFVSDPFSAPEGYEAFDDHGLFESYVSGQSRGADEPMYTIYKKAADNGETHYILYDLYKYNHTKFTIAEGKEDEFAAIYEKYREDLDMGYYYLCGGVAPHAELWDWFDDITVEDKDFSDAIDKSVSILKFVSEAYRAGCLTDVRFEGITAYSQWGYHNVFSICLNPDENTGLETMDTMQQIADGFGSDIIKTADEETDWYVINLHDDNMYEFFRQVKEQYPDVSGGCALFQQSAEEVRSGGMDIITGSEYSYCDADGNGKVELDDAVTVLQHYAQTAVGISADETASLTADSNGDGTVSLDDAVMVLTSYAESAAGVEN